MFMKPMMTWLRLSALAAAAVSVSACSVTAGGRPNLPETTLLASYEDYQASGEIVLDATVPGFVPGADYEPLTPEVLARMDATTRGYPRVTAVIDRILDDILAASPRPELRPEVALRSAPSANASAPRADLIILTTGMFSALMCAEDLERTGDCLIMPDDRRIDALAFVIAHEYAHGLLGHPHQFSQRQEELRIADDLATLLAGAATLQQVAGSYGVDMGEDYQSLTEGLGVALVASPVIEGELYRGAFAPYARQAESDADFLATDILMQTNKYDPFVGSEALRDLFPRYNSVVTERLETALEASADRAQAYSGVMLASVPDAVLSNNSQALGSSFRQVLITEGIQLGLHLYGLFSQTDDVHLHFAGEARADAVSEYGALFSYPRPSMVVSLDAFGVQSGGGFDPQAYARNTAVKSDLGVELREGWAQESRPLLAAQRARELMALGDLDGARSELDAVSGGEAVTEYLMAQGQLNLAMGEYLRASEWFLNATRQPDATHEAWAGLATGRFKRDQFERALNTLDEAERLFGEDVLLTERIRFLAVSDPDQAVAISARCDAAYDTESEQQECRLAAPVTAMTAVDESGPDQAEPTGPGGLLRRSIPWRNGNSGG